MPVSGHEETGVKSFAGQFSDAIAGVPIKKRRFPLIRPCSPLSEEPCSLTEESELPRKENSTTSQGTTLSNASIAGAPIKKRRFPLLQASSSPLGEVSPPEESDALRKEHSNTSQGSTLSTSSSGLSDTNGNPSSEERKASVSDTNMVQSNSLYLRPKLEELNVATQSCMLDVLESKEKVLLNEDYEEKLGSEMNKKDAKLLLAAKEGLTLDIGADVSEVNQKICKQESPLVPESPNLSLYFKDHLFPAVPSMEIDKSCLRMEKAEPVSLRLSLSKEECSSDLLNSDIKNNSDTALVHSNRANWDLNTTMDAWEESGTDAGSVKTSVDAGSVKTAINDAGSVKTSVDDTGSVKTSVDGLKITNSALDGKHLMYSAGMAPPPIGVASVKQTCEESQKKSFIISSGMYAQQCKYVDTHDISLASCLQKYAEEPSRPSVKLNSGSAIPTMGLSSVVASAGDVNTASFRLVKSEPVDENLKKDVKKANACPPSSLDIAAVKWEFVERSNIDTFKSSTDKNVNFVDPTFIKSEPGHEGNQRRPKTAETETAQLGMELPQISENCSSAMAMLETLETVQLSVDTACPSVKPICSTEFTASENLVNQLENHNSTEGAVVEKVSLGTSSSTEQVSLETVAISMVDNGTDLSGLDMKNSSIRTRDENADSREGCMLKLMNEPPPDPRDSEGCISDEEKITLSADMLEDESYDSDYESDDIIKEDIHAPTGARDAEQRGDDDDDYEDGEVREPLMHSTAEGTICELREVEHPGCSNYESEVMEKGVVSDDCPTSFNGEESKNTTLIQVEMGRGEDGVDIEMHERAGKVIDKNVCPQESLDAQKSTTASDGKRLVNVLQRKSLDLSERKEDCKVSETELSSDQAVDGSHGVVVPCADEVLKTTDTVRQTDSDFPKMEASINADDAAKDVNNSGNQGRIIDLSRAASSSSPNKTRSISGRSLPSRAGRDVLSDRLDGDKLHRGRDEVYIDAPRKFSRERHQEMSPRNSRLNFVRGRGRVNSRIDSFRGEWESDREFSGEFYNGPSQFRGPRSKYASAIADTELEYNDAPDGSYVGNGRVGRKPMNDEGPFCRHIASRRRSPGGRDSIQMGHRIPRNMSPSRCIGGDGSELVGMRHGEKFMRGFPDDTLDPMLTRSQPFEGLDGQFTRGRRNFSSFQRRGLPRIRSKSPIRSRSRSPGPWSSRRSPRRRSPDGFGGHPELTHRRSPLYRVVDRMRSPDRPVFAGERMVRRHGSPPYMSRPSNDVRDIDSARDHGHPRAVISSRSPSGRILIRNRRYDDFFGGPMHSGRLLDLNGEGNVEERRRFGERRGPVRSFRPPYNGSVGENFDLNGEDGPRHYRFCSDDSDFHERGNLRERDFDRRIKGRPGNVPPRRTRNMDEQEENYRHGGQVWSDDSFDDISTVKRKRF